MPLPAPRSGETDPPGCPEPAATSSRMAIAVRTRTRAPWTTRRMRRVTCAVLLDDELAGDHVHGTRITHRAGLARREADLDRLVHGQRPADGIVLQDDLGGARALGPARDHEQDRLPSPDLHRGGLEAFV